MLNLRIIGDNWHWFAIPFFFLPGEDIRGATGCRRPTTERIDGKFRKPGRRGREGARRSAGRPGFGSRRVCSEFGKQPGADFSEGEKLQNKQNSWEANTAQINPRESEILGKNYYVLQSMEWIHGSGGRPPVENRVALGPREGNGTGARRRRCLVGGKRRRLEGVKLGPRPVHGGILRDRGNSGRLTKSLDRCFTELECTKI